MPGKRKTHCHKGHPLTDDNVILRASDNTRLCKTCSEERYRNYRSRPETRERERQNDRKRYKNPSRREQMRIANRKSQKRPEALAKKRTWDAANRERLSANRKESQRKWREANRAHEIARHQSRRLSESIVKFPLDHWIELVSRFNGWCPYCGEYTEKLTVDHVVPISAGGTNTIENLIPCCSSCNSKKGAKLLDQFVQYLLDREEAANAASSILPNLLMISSAHFDLHKLYPL